MCFFFSFFKIYEKCLKDQSLNLRSEQVKMRKKSGLDNAQNARNLIFQMHLLSCSESRKRSKLWFFSPAVSVASEVKKKNKQTLQTFADTFLLISIVFLTFIPTHFILKWGKTLYIVEFVPQKTSTSEDISLRWGCLIDKLKEMSNVSITQDGLNKEKRKKLTWGKKE